MNKLELKDLVKKYFNLTEMNSNNPQAHNASFTEATLADGTKISNKVDADFEVGQELYVIAEDGSEVLAPSGEHTTESGIVLTVDGEGKITGVKQPDAAGEGSLVDDAAPVAEQMAEEIEIEVPSVVDAIDPEMDIKEAIIEAIAEVVAPELEMLKSKMADMEELMKKQYASTPAAKSSLEARFSKSENKPLGFLNEKFDAKKAQYESVLKRNKNN